MKRLAIPLLALLAAGCWPAADFRLSPMNGAPRWQHGHAVVRRDSAGIEVSVAFDRSAGGYLVFDVTVVNHSDSIWLAGPEGFWYELSAPGGRVPRRSATPVPALDPEVELTFIDRQLASEAACQSDEVGAAVASGLLDAIAVLAREDHRGGHAPAIGVAWPGSRDSDDAVHAMHMRRLAALRGYWAAHALRRTHVEPGGALSGKIALRAGPLDALTWTHETGDADITRAREASERPPVVLTLHGPADPTGEGIAYRVTRL